MKPFYDNICSSFAFFLFKILKSDHANIKKWNDAQRNLIND
jgi:hypothetical protein